MMGVEIYPATSIILMCFDTVGDCVAIMKLRFKYD